MNDTSEKPWAFWQLPPEEISKLPPSILQHSTPHAYLPIRVQAGFLIVPLHNVQFNLPASIADIVKQLEEWYHFEVRGYATVTIQTNAGVLEFSGKEQEPGSPKPKSRPRSWGLKTKWSVPVVFTGVQETPLLTPPPWIENDTDLGELLDSPFGYNPRMSCGTKNLDWDQVFEPKTDPIVKRLYSEWESSPSLEMKPLYWLAFTHLYEVNSNSSVPKAAVELAFTAGRLAQIAADIAYRHEGILGTKFRKGRPKTDHTRLIDERIQEFRIRNGRFPKAVELIRFCGWASRRSRIKTKKGEYKMSTEYKGVDREWRTLKTLQSHIARAKKEVR